MNREIKFRIFNEAENEMQNVVSLWHNPKSGISHVVVALDEEYTEVDTLFRGYKLMQYTGLKDKNGKEIYEGDILKRIITFDGQSSEFIEKVIFHGACFCTLDQGEIESNKSSYLANYLGHNIEIIGNIHEHKNLL